jgi:hypothetical protein
MNDRYARAGAAGGYQRKNKELGEWRRGLPKLTQEQQAELMVDYIARVPIKVIAERYGIHPSTVCQLAARRGVALRESRQARANKAQAATNRKTK